MALSIQYKEEESHPLSIFLYALKAPETKRQYPRRLKVFLDFLKLDGTLKQQSKEFLEKAKQNPQWAQNSIMQFISLQKERARKGEISKENQDLQDFVEIIKHNSHFPVFPNINTYDDLIA